MKRHSSRLVMTKSIQNWKKILSKLRRPLTQDGSEGEVAGATTVCWGIHVSLDVTREKFWVIRPEEKRRISQEAEKRKVSPQAHD